MREILIVLCAVLHQILAHVVVSIPQKEHKVHNIVLYPDKHSWCKTTPIKQVVTHPGCKSMEIDNNVCVGACFSYSIPNTEPKTPGDVQPYCDSCQPAEIKWKQIILECPDSDYGEDNTTVKSVEMISSCACASCKDPNSRSTEGSGKSSSQAELDVPELMSLMMETHNTREKMEEKENAAEISKEEVTSFPDSGVTEAITERVAITLKKMDDAEAMLDLEALQEIRSKIEQDNHKIEDDLSLSSFMEKMKSEQNVRVLGISDSTALDGNHSRHHRVLGPHHSLVYPAYSLDIAAELYAQEQLKSKPTLDVASSSEGTSHQNQDNEVTAHQHQESDISSHHQDNDVISHQPDHMLSEDNLLFATTEEKISLKRKIETNGEGPR